jgi:hypothetical protein
LRIKSIKKTTVATRWFFYVCVLVLLCIPRAALFLISVLHLKVLTDAMRGQITRPVFTLDSKMNHHCFHDLASEQRRFCVARWLSFAVVQCRLGPSFLNPEAFTTVLARKSSPMRKKPKFRNSVIVSFNEIDD